MIYGKRFKTPDDRRLTCCRPFLRVDDGETFLWNLHAAYCMSMKITHYVIILPALVRSYTGAQIGRNERHSSFAVVSLL